MGTKNNRQDLDSHARRRLPVWCLGLALALTLPVAEAHAQDADTVILRPTGGKGVKARHLKRIDASLAKSAKSAENLSMAASDGGKITGTNRRKCATDAACLAKAGDTLGAERVVGVLVETSKSKSFTLTFVLVDIAAKTELTRAVETIKKGAIRKAPGPALEKFLANAAALHPATTAPDLADELDPAQPGDLDAAQPGDLDASPDTEPAAEGPDTAPADSVPAPDTETIAEAAPEPVATVNTTVISAEQPSKIHVGLHAGLILPQLQSELGTTGGLELEFGYRAWKSLSPVLAVGYTQPVVESSLSDPRLPADYMTETTQRELTISVGAMWRFLPLNQKLNAYAAIAARVWLLETLTKGEAGGQTFLQNTETSTRYGGAVAGGAEYHVGPGAAVFEIDVGGSNLPHLITGDVATTAVSSTVGYRLMF